MLTYEDHAVYPDIIVCQHGKDNNLLATEVNENNRDASMGKTKLQEYLVHVQYRYSLVVRAAHTSDRRPMTRAIQSD